MTVKTEEILAPLSTSAFLHYTQQPLPNAVEEALLLLPCVHPVAGDRERVRVVVKDAPSPSVGA